MLLSFYGDDFTGSTDVMESMALHGVNTVLFTRIPTAEEQARFAGFDAVGIAGTSRSQTPDWMDAHLPQYFRWLKALGARFCHYKVCSTFDSAPHVGNIGRAIEIGRGVFAQQVTPLVVGAPQLRRYTAFGHLFAGYQGKTYRIDRHPVMSRHPVTPMDEADLRLHLARQTQLPVDLVPANALDDPAVDQVISAATGIVLFDVFGMATQIEVGGQLLRLSPRLGPFIVGSSGVEYALVKALAASGRIAGSASFPSLPKVARTIAVSGSCSPTTARQIKHALAHGFTGLHADPLDLARGPDDAVARLSAEAKRLMGEGRSVLVYTALDPETDRGGPLDQIAGGRHRVGQGLGRIARACIESFGLRRTILAGGDTSSHALGELDVFALTTRFPLLATPGSPLCAAASADPKLDGLEIAMKGGQVGGDDYFVALRDGLTA
ncbi:four-carbon acid sugar kinase family protein [Aestuariivirga litoralis]|uniref:Four-carbon acid sugar kinase family protein n=1 Tax=Aestuariivirga litoralis TaxID=2650924 RepID=A0A2W2BCN0_9HYPH|nr:four-carbon acid sugar kinase family protein [Aestuariivirga litoralis]PZF77938.1 four-carbon acid sugar kinase family protein [Aestuariivirga litoralis]